MAKIEIEKSPDDGTGTDSGSLQRRKKFMTISKPMLLYKACLMYPRGIMMDWVLHLYTLCVISY